MTNENPVRKAQTGEPTGNGGHFGSASRDEAAVELGAETDAAPSPIQLFDAAAATVRKMELRAITDEIATRTRALFPAATAVVVERGSGGHWAFKHVLGGNGEFLTAEGGYMYGDDPDAYELDNQIQPLINRYGLGKDAFDSGTITTDKENSITGALDGTIELDRPIDVDAAAARVAEALEIAGAVGRETTRARAAHVGAMVKSLYPGAASVELFYGELEANERAYLFASSVSDADGNELWSSGGGRELPVEVDNEIYHLNPAYLDLDSSTSTTRIDI